MTPGTTRELRELEEEIVVDTRGYAPGRQDRWLPSVSA